MIINSTTTIQYSNIITFMEMNRLKTIEERFQILSSAYHQFITKGYVNCKISDGFIPLSAIFLLYSPFKCAIFGPIWRPICSLTNFGPLFSIQPFPSFHRTASNYGGGANFRFLVWQKSYQGTKLDPIRLPICCLTNFGPLFSI